MYSPTCSLEMCCCKDALLKTRFQVSADQCCDWCAHVTLRHRAWYIAHDCRPHPTSRVSLQRLQIRHTMRLVAGRWQPWRVWRATCPWSGCCLQSSAPCSRPSRTRCTLACGMRDVHGRARRRCGFAGCWTAMSWLLSAVYFHGLNQQHVVLFLLAASLPQTQ
jgi:hypothetical protein